MAINLIATSTVDTFILLMSQWFFFSWQKLFILIVEMRAENFLRLKLAEHNRRVTEKDSSGVRGLHGVGTAARKAMLA